ncbi:dTDP-4-dehydrorhamnose reductase [Streptomyces zagrosensis]|uniref:dTDP-4-dehydrorhamnose reductase n=1 Tax=Streptomyces zagrosensis TaxID=1042984 RepID=A0A7W9QC88_9ACTN|nr:dTDP-4-dehydrorhamnose reductase [Streptomyces zagrosensis]MBB5937254.1 dTDP-4-dehydrorhamnose reductase [Streptomyces zagrosensis]
MNGWLITGAGGLLGRELRARLAAASVPALPLTHADLDLTDTEAVARAVRRTRPAVVVNCAAWTDVDGAESHEAAALRVNGDAVRSLARACATTGSRLLHVSSDYVFPGRSTMPYDETARPGPRTAYGRTRLAGERAVLEELPRTGTVVRTAWLYGAHGRNVIRTMAAQAAAGDTTLAVAHDQHGQPTWTKDVAGRLLALGRLPASQAAGIFHATCGGRTTWYDLAREVFRMCGADPDRVLPVDSASFNRPAQRPAWSVLGHARWEEAGLTPPRHWRDALAVAFRSVTAEGPPARRRPDARRPVASAARSTVRALSG